MTYKQIRFRISRQFDLSPSIGDDRDLIDQWINQTVLDFSRRAKINLQMATIALTVDVGDYELSQDILAFDDVWIDPASGNPTWLLQAVDSSEIQRMRRLEGAVSHGVMYYALEGENLFMIYPNAESSSDELNMMYVPKPAAFTDQDESPADATLGRIPDEYHYTLLDGVKAEAADFRGDFKGAEHYRLRYDTGVERAKTNATRKGGMVIGSVRIGRPSRQFPLSPGVDLGG